MNNENNFTHDGVEYVADSTDDIDCNGCDLYGRGGVCINGNAPCLACERKDNTGVIFKVKLSEGKTMKPFDLEAAKNGAKVVTRDGRKARVICFDAMQGAFALVALITSCSGVELAYTFTAGGRFYQFNGMDSESDLLMAPVKKECWINLYPNNGVACFETEGLAIINSSESLVSRIHHTWQE